MLSIKSYFFGVCCLEKLDFCSNWTYNAHHVKNNCQRGKLNMVMKHKIMTLVVSSSLLLTAAFSSVASAHGGHHWHPGHHWYPRHHWYPHRHWHYYHRADIGAAMLFGGLMGAALENASQQQQYDDSYYQPAYECHKEPIWTHRFCNDSGCYDRTAWETVCN